MRIAVKERKLDPSVKKALDLRLARGEISETEYCSLLKTIATSREHANEGVMSALMRIGGNATKAIDKLLIGTDKVDYALLKRNPTNDEPFKVSNDFDIYGDYLLYKGDCVAYDQIVGLSFFAVESKTGTMSGMPLGMSCKSKLIVRFGDEGRRIEVNVKSGSYFDSKSSFIRKAYDFIREKSFRQRMAIYLGQLEQPGFIEMDGAKLYRNGDVEKGGTRINLHAARQNNMIQKGTTYGGLWTAISGAQISGTKPNEMIVGENGTGFFARRVKFEVDQDHDVLFSIIEHLSEGKRI